MTISGNQKFTMSVEDKNKKASTSRVAADADARTGSEMADNGWLEKRPPSGASGYSLIDLLLVVTIIAIVTSFALVQITQARRNMARANEARLFTAYLEKCRLDSIKRHVTTPSEMAQITIINASFYSVAMDFDGNGTIDSPRVVSLPADSNLSFNGPFPRTIYFNWRGRTVDMSGNLTVPSPISVSNSYGTNSINITDGGQPSIDKPVTADPVTESAPPAPVFRSQTTIP